MWFWVFMFIMNLMIPFLMIGFGWLFRKRSPKNINPLYGYRTKMSMKNMETWQYAHIYFGRLWFRAGWPMLLVTILAMIPLWGKTEDVIGSFCIVIQIVQMVALLLPIVATERELRRQFYTDGRRKTQM